MNRQKRRFLGIPGRASSYKTRLFLYFFLLVFIVMGVLSSIYYVNLKNAMERNLISTNSSTINQIRNSVEETIANMRYSCLQLAYDSTVEIFMTLYEQRDKDITEVIEFLERLNSKIAYNKAIDGGFIYYERQKKVVDVSLGRILDKDQMTSFGDDKTYLETNRRLIDRIMAELDYGAATVSGIHIANVNLGDSDVVAFVKPIGPVKVGSNIVLFLTMDSACLNDILNSIESGREASVFIVDDRNKVVAARSGVGAGLPEEAMEPVWRKAEGQHEGDFLERVDGKKYLISYVESKTVAWKYFYFLPTDFVSRSLRTMRIQLLLILGGCLAVGLLASLVVALGLYRPIRRLVGTLNAYDSRADGADGDELGYLENSFNRLLSENRDKEETIRDSIPVIRNAILANILQKKSGIDDGIWEKIAYYNIAIGQDRDYVVFTLGIDGQEELANGGSEKQVSLIEIYQIELVKRVCSNYRGLAVQNVKTDSPELNFIVSISVDDNAKEVLFRFLDGIRQAILENMNYSTTIGIGSICGDIGEVHTSYEEARTAYGYKVFLGGGRVISIDDAPGDKDWYYIHPIKIEKGLLQHLREADVRAMLESLAEYLESVMTRSLDPFKLKLVSIHLLDNIITCCLEMGCNIGDALSEERDLYKELLERNDIASVHVWFKRLLVDVAGYMNMRKDEHSKEFVVRIAAYIDENFMRPEICMDSICDHFHFSPSFISRVFREVKGKTVKQYITERRFERAMELIENSNMKIKEIGSCVGYTNTQSFLKIFKRYHGETPREYRSRSVNDPAR